MYNYYGCKLLSYISNNLFPEILPHLRWSFYRQYSKSVLAASDTKNSLRRDWLVKLPSILLPWKNHSNRIIQLSQFGCFWSFSADGTKRFFLTWGYVNYISPVAFAKRLSCCLLNFSAHSFLLQLIKSSYLMASSRYII